MDKPKSDILNFEDNKPVTVTLKTEPSEAKSNRREGKFGVFYTTTYFVEGNKVFFATNTLHERLKPYHKGDTLKIVKTNNGDRTSWNVVLEGHEVGARSSDEVSNISFQTNVLKLLGQIDTQQREILDYIYGKDKKPKEINKEVLPEEQDEDLGF